MKKMFKAALAATIVVGTAGAAHADLTYQGAVGMPLNPTAQVPANGAWRLQGDYFDTGHSSHYYAADVAGSFVDNLEVDAGLQSEHASGGGSNSGAAFGAKYLLTHESDPLGFRLAVGGGYWKVAGHDEYGYLVGTKALNAGAMTVTGNLGVRYDKWGGNGLDSSKTSVYAGLEVPITSDHAFKAVGEIQSKNIDNGSTPYSLSVRWAPKAQPFSGSIGVQRLGFTNTNGVFVQVGYTFGK